MLAYLFLGTRGQTGPQKRVKVNAEKAPAIDSSSSSHLGTLDSGGRNSSAPLASEPNVTQATPSVVQFTTTAGLTIGLQADASCMDGKYSLCCIALATKNTAHRDSDPHQDL